MTIWETIAAEAAAESPLWEAALRPTGERELEPVFSELGEPRFALATETIYEGYLLHYGTSRLFRPADGDTAVLLGDYLYAHGLVRLARHEDVRAVTDLAELISICTQLRADGTEAARLDGPVWAATASALGSGNGALVDARDAVRLGRDVRPLLELAAVRVRNGALEQALAAHASRVE